jgi:transcriptional regulator with XRE-family HTH domain
MLLGSRDVAALLRFAQRYGSASQARLAAATGIGQARINEIANGKREVVRLDVFTRLADGLNMPDDARIALGLAPRQPGRADTYAVSGEIAQVYRSQEPVAAEIRRRAQDAAELDVLAVRALGIISLNDSPLRPALLGRDVPLRVRVLLVQPDCPAARQRAEEIGETWESFAAGIRLALARLAEVATAHPTVDMEVRLYTRLPVWRTIRLDGMAYVSSFSATWEGHESVIYEIPDTPRGSLWAGFRRQFEDVLANSEPII